MTGGGAGRLAPVPDVLAVPDPGGGVAPPGAEKFTLLLQWGAWLVVAACVGGVLFIAGTMAIRHRRGDGGAEAAAGLGWVLVACILVGSASGFVAALID